MLLNCGVEQVSLVVFKSTPPSRQSLHFLVISIQDEHFELTEKGNDITKRCHDSEREK
jgi:hypothetical protein